MFYLPKKSLSFPAWLDLSAAPYRTRGELNNTGKEMQTVDDLNSTLSAILGDPAKMEQLRQVAQSLGIGPGTGAPDAGAANAAPPASGGQSGGQGGGIDPNAIASILQNFQNAGNGGTAAASGAGAMPDLGAISKLSGILNSFNQSDKNVELLRALKPHFSPARASKIDDAVRIMQLIHAWPSVRDSGLLGSLGNLFSGGNRSK
ncbi:hypothetical protein D3Z39_09565 [Anaerotruncus colihominis]|uniref:Uncharacterized protein n=1 Tax=Anaerotruncus colihominis TaxID=169435 RepID=A0A845RJW4_9FIRM|nr:hypothetical protein [Anaerotruncus colihominis]